MKTEVNVDNLDLVLGELLKLRRIEKEMRQTRKAIMNGIFDSYDTVPEIKKAFDDKMIRVSGEARFPVDAVRGLTMEAKVIILLDLMEKSCK